MTREISTVSMPEHFANIADVYRGVRTTDLEPIFYIRNALASRSVVRATDVGCGAGRYSRLLFEYIPDLHLVCADVSTQMLEMLSSYFAEGGIQNFSTQLSNVQDLALANESLDAVFTFNAVHHFNFAIFLAKARCALRDDGHLFIYTRTPDQNAGSVWGRFFPNFTEKESRLYTLDRMKAWIRQTPGVRIVEAEVFRYARTAAFDRLQEQVRNRHYSTFSLYDQREFEAACRIFSERISHRFKNLDAISWHDENIMLHVIKT